MEELKPLIKLQEIDLEIRRIEKRLKEEIPSLLNEIQEGKEKAELIVKQAEEKIEKNLKERRELDLEIKSIEESIKKHREQLNSVKTNEAYKALMEEIEAEERKKSSMEDRTLELMIEEEELQKEKKKSEEEAQRIKAEFSEREQKILDEKNRLSVKIDELKNVREELTNQIDGSLYKLYIQISTKRNGIALSPVTDGFCSVCQIRIRPQVMEELRKGGKIIRCENCSRILYIPEIKEPAS